MYTFVCISVRYLDLFFAIIVHHSVWPKKVKAKAATSNISASTATPHDQLKLVAAKTTLPPNNLTNFLFFGRVDGNCDQIAENWEKIKRLKILILGFL